MRHIVRNGGVIFNGCVSSELVLVFKFGYLYKGWIYLSMGCCLPLVSTRQLGIHLFLKQYRAFWFQLQKVNGPLSFKVAHFSVSFRRDKDSSAAEHNRLFWSPRGSWAWWGISGLDPTPTLKQKLCCHSPQTNPLHKGLMNNDNVTGRFLGRQKRSMYPLEIVLICRKA